jgi:hypothetical protein
VALAALATAPRPPAHAHAGAHAPHERPPRAAGDDAVSDEVRAPPTATRTHNTQRAVRPFALCFIRARACPHAPPVPTLTLTC